MTGSHEHEHEHQHEHGVRDSACATAHGDPPAPDEDRHLAAVFASPVAMQLAHLAAHGDAVVPTSEDLPQAGAVGLEVEGGNEAKRATTLARRRARRARRARTWWSGRAAARKTRFAAASDRRLG